MLNKFNLLFPFGPSFLSVRVSAPANGNEIRRRGNTLCGGMAPARNGSASSEQRTEDRGKKCCSRFGRNYLHVQCPSSCVCVCGWDCAEASFICVGLLSTSAAAQSRSHTVDASKWHNKIKHIQWMDSSLHVMHRLCASTPFRRIYYLFRVSPQRPSHATTTTRREQHKPLIQRKQKPRKKGS